MPVFRIISFPAVFFIGISAVSQPQFSLATDLSLFRNFKNEQRYWAIGQTVYGQFHITSKQSAFIFFDYYSVGKFKDNLSANAKSTSTTPQRLNFTSNAEMRLTHLSIGWKHYFKGVYNSDSEWNLYGIAGFGLLLGKVLNTYSIPLDTALYIPPSNPINGAGKFKRLTLDLAGGWEVPIGIDFYFYVEGRAWIPTTDYPSKYLFVNDNAPFIATLNVGLRVLFD